jgi:hypothetical protein
MEAEAAVVAEGTYAEEVVYQDGCVTAVEAVAPLAVVAIRYNPDVAAWALARFHPSLRPTRAT